MYAIVQQGSKQFEVEKGKIYQFDKMMGEVGQEISFKEILLVVDGETRNIGTPFVKGAEVKGTVIGDAKGKKVISFKFRRRKSSKKKIGHRQKYTLIKIADIKA
jgi:large subunit ribosomal protein L21